MIRAEEGLEKIAWARTLHLSGYSDTGKFQKVEFSQEESKDALYKSLEEENNSTLFLENIEKLSDEDKAVVKQKLITSSNKNKTKIFICPPALEDNFFMSEQEFTELSIPPIRSSLKEVPKILDETVRFFVEREGHGYRRFSLAAQNMLSKYQWPGNLRQLVDLVQAVLSRKEKEIVNVDEIKEIITLQGPGGNILIENNILSLSMKEAKKLFERAYLTRQLELVGGKISELSRRVDMERTNLYRKLQSLDIDYKKKKKTTS